MFFLLPCICCSILSCIISGGPALFSLSGNEGSSTQSSSSYNDEDNSSSIIGLCLCCFFCFNFIILSIGVLYMIYSYNKKDSLDF